MEVAALVLHEGVAGEIPAVADIRALPLVGEIATPGRAAYCKLADLTARFLLHVVVDDFCLVTGHWLSGASRCGVAETVRDENVQHFGRADAVENGLAGFRDPIVEYRRWQRLAG